MPGELGELLKMALCEPQRTMRLDLGEEDLSKEQLMLTSMATTVIEAELVYEDQKRRICKILSLNCPHTLGRAGHGGKGGEARRWVLGGNGPFPEHNHMWGHQQGSTFQFTSWSGSRLQYIHGCSVVTKGKVMVQMSLSW